ncbi:glycosyltransferase family 39 protein [Mesorhizobium sp. B3-1-6]|uniref:glycosyltransferase family 39 protein n=1 Tax=Mesorhizobium sp. B3-1-6 TaxID=2589895 RepID=UPI00112ECF50|nr:glycosyltransferase family 39 protein [Mesorhizobium sp. B3-1-6]TPI43378.1 glycosyltransferase family 39 protein [Mesorhizobium sp. B3-1-6]
MTPILDRSPAGVSSAGVVTRTLVLCLLVLAAAVPWQMRWGVIPDTSWAITMAERVLSGSRLYVDLFEVNPPFTPWLFMPAVALAQALGLSPEVVIHVYAYAVCLIGLGFAALIARQAGFAENSALLSMLPLFLALLVIFPGNAFSEREHLGVALFLPLLVLMAWRAAPANETRPSLLVAVLAGLGGSVLLLVKPYYALVVFVPALYVAWRRRSILPLLAVEYWVIGLICVAYAVAVMLCYPEFLSVIYPILADTYMRMGNMQALLIDYAPVYLIALLMLHFLRPGLTPSPLVSVFTLASLAATAPLIYQAKGWPYHAFPAFSLLLAALLMRTAQIDQAPRSSAGRTMEPGQKLLLAAIVVAAAIPFMKTQKPGAEFVAKVKAAVHQPTVALVGSDIAAGHPLTRMLGGTWISRYCSDWLSDTALYLSAIATRDGNKEAASHYREMADRYIDGKLAELETKRPTILIIQKNNQASAEELSRHQDYVRLMQDYRPIAEDETVRVLLRDTRVSPAPSPAEASD